MIGQSFRYCLGRSTYVVADFVTWAIDNWENIPKQEQYIIKRELQDAFEKDAIRKPELIFNCVGPLGMEMDKKEWKILQDRINEQEG